MYDEILARVRARIRDRIEDLPSRDARIKQAFTAISDEMNPYMTATEEPVSWAMVEAAYDAAEADPLTRNVRALAIRMVEHAVETNAHLDNVILGSAFWTHLGPGPVFEHPAVVFARRANPEPY